MEKSFDPKQIENSLYATWEKAGYFVPIGKGAPYSIVIPPPNVTGFLHMGHGFQLSIMDALIRYQRMCGKNTHWQLGTDHAGIATQLLVEQQIKTTGKTKHDLGRAEFLKKIWAWKEISQNQITNQQRRLGISGDWSRLRFTLDDGLSTAVQKVFITLHAEGLIYRGKRLVHWDPILKTAVSDLEVIFKEQDGKLWHIRYPLADDATKSITVATTRPETMLGDVAVAVHPDDPRYQKFIGKQIKLPLTERLIPVIADEYVDREFGSGCVKITPAHDLNDYAIAKRHNLPLINILTPDATLNENVPTAYQNLERFAARKKILADLENLHLLEKIEPHKNKIPLGDRSGAILEPYLTDQWFVKMKPLAAKALAALENGEFKFVPENWSNTYKMWLENIEDWCISRQLWWGHRIPAWYDTNGKIYVGENEKAVRTKFNLGDQKLTQDEDVLDTWFSSALWPFSSLGWPEATQDYKNFYPTSVLVTGFDIIFFWVARMVMLGIHFTGKVPFKDVYITGLIRDSKGQKMSKSKGNIIDPIDLIDGITLDALIQKRTSNLLQESLKEKVIAATKEEFPDGIPACGTDALRFTFCALASTSRDINFDPKRLEGYRNFCTKIWNASRYVLMNTEGFDAKNSVNEASLADRWINAKMEELIKTVRAEFANYRFDLVCQALYDFIWRDYCDWYLELAKVTLNSESAAATQKNSTRRTLLEVLEKTLRLMHPFMPFITETVWQQVAPLLGEISASSTIMLQKYPENSAANFDQSALDEIAWLQKIILAIRNIRSEMNIAPGKPLTLLLQKGSATDKKFLQQHEIYLYSIARLEKIAWADTTNKPKEVASAIVGELELYIPLSGLIDMGAEKERLTKELAKLEKEQIALAQKLSNPNFKAKAPQEVVAKDEARLIELKKLTDKIKQKLSKLD